MSNENDKNPKGKSDGELGTNGHQPFSDGHQVKGWQPAQNVSGGHQPEKPSSGGTNTVPPVPKPPSKD